MTLDDIDTAIAQIDPKLQHFDREFLRLRDLADEAQKKGSRLHVVRERLLKLRAALVAAREDGTLAEVQAEPKGEPEVEPEVTCGYCNGTGRARSRCGVGRVEPPF